MTSAPLQPQSFPFPTTAAMELPFEAPWWEDGQISDEALNLSLEEDLAFLNQRPVAQQSPGDRQTSISASGRTPVTVACVQCRSRHLKCDGGTRCSRCRADNLPCTYVKSRRGYKGARKSRVVKQGEQNSASKYP